MTILKYLMDESLPMHLKVFKRGTNKDLISRCTPHLPLLLSAYAAA
jgi:hypothetical protein